jgi:PIN domain nuclease of toxin-antitoxin system
LRAQGFTARPLAWDEAEQANLLPPLHKDPMDRMLIATAIRHDLTIITDDAVFAEYGVRTIW